MIRTAASRSMLLAVSALLVGTAAAGCNRAKRDNDAGGVGSASFELKVPGATVDKVDWSIAEGAPPANPPVVAKSGSVDVPQDGPSASFLVSGLSPGSFTISLTATATTQNPDNTDPVTCAGTGTFMIAAGQTSKVNVILQCNQTPTKGNIAVNTRLDFEDCPFVTSYLVSSTQPGLNGTIDVSAMASDRDPALTMSLNFQWSATAGTFDNANAATTKYHCPMGVSDAQTLTIYVTNGVSKMPDACPLAKQTIKVLCVPLNCGDGVVQANLGESCDNGYSSAGIPLNGPGTGCSYDCKSDKCGNGVLDPGEACDNGTNNGKPGNFCTTVCTINPVCGDGVKHAPEQCDDGNTTGGDGCSANCTSESAVCGNGITEAFGGEQCDDGNTVSNDGCSSTCKSETAVCGNGIKETFGNPPEQCDDGNTAAGDGCSPTCQTEAAICGNGVVEAWGGEQCDDSNTTSLDGCSATCKLENACFVCREKRRGVAGGTGCNARMGCETAGGTQYTTAADTALCVSMRDCMYANPTCWAASVDGCYCGTAVGADCNTMPNGICKNQTVAAAKVASMTDYTTTGIRFFDTNFPTGHASQEFVCNNKCIGTVQNPPSPNPITQADCKAP